MFKSIQYVNEKDMFYQETTQIESVVNIFLNDSATALSHTCIYTNTWRNNNGRLQGQSTVAIYCYDSISRSLFMFFVL